MTNFSLTSPSVTYPSTARGRGRPAGCGGYADQDRQLFPKIEPVLKPIPQVATLRDAVRPLVPHLAGAGTELARIRRFERLYRAEVST